MQIGAVTIGTEEPSGQNFCRCTAGRETGGDEQGRKDSGVDQREADQSRNQEAGVGTDRNRKDKNDPVQSHSEFGKEADDRVKPLKPAHGRNFLLKRNAHQHENERYIEQKRHHANAHDGSRVVINQNSPEEERIGQVQHQADHAENDRNKTDQSRRLHDGCVEVNASEKVHTDRNGNRPPEIPAKNRYTAIGQGQATPSVRPIVKSNMIRLLLSER